MEVQVANINSWTVASRSSDISNLRMMERRLRCAREDGP